MAEFLSDLIDKLTKPREEVVQIEREYEFENSGGEHVIHTVKSTQTISHPPLLELLRNEISASLGMTRGGANQPFERLMLSVDAFTLYEDIDGRIASLYNTATDQKPMGFPEANLVAWHEIFNKAFLRGELNDAQVALAWERVEAWVDRIERFFNPPVVKEISANCPEADCGERYWVEKHKGPIYKRVSAMYLQIEAGKEVEAHCRWCGARWIGEEQLVQLGKEIGLTIDVDALRNAHIVHTTETTAPA